MERPRQGVPTRKATPHPLWFSSCYEGAAEAALKGGRVSSGLQVAGAPLTGKGSGALARVPTYQVEDEETKDGKRTRKAIFL